MNKKLLLPHYICEGDFLKKGIFLLISFIIGMLVFTKNDEIIIPSDAIRVRIIANSDNISDLYVKSKLKEEIKKDLYNFIKDANNSKEAKQGIESNLNAIEQIVSSRIKDYKLDFGKNYFPRKTYKGIIYDEGEYDSLVITLGKGLGENWWCVLYPPLCLIDDNTTTSDVEYRSLVLDILNKK